MTKTFSNKDIDGIIQTMESPSSFTKNPNINPPFEILWALKVNIKKLMEIYTLITDAKNEILKKHFDSNCFVGHINEDGTKSTKIKSEYTMKW